MRHYLNNFHLPKDMGKFDIASDEVMYYLYLPIKRPNLGWADYDHGLPDLRLHFTIPLLSAVAEDLTEKQWEESYIYLTIKKMFVGGGVTANRPGWHCDGFMSDDLNYVWFDVVPTLFTSLNPHISADHSVSLIEFEKLDEEFRNSLVTYPAKHLLRLDDKVIHAVDTDVPEQIMRTFVKITVSKDRYNLKDNSRNPLLPDDGEFFDRTMVRNDPHHAQSDVYKPTPEEDHFK